MSPRVSVEELRDTVARMESRLRLRNDALAAQLLKAYDDVVTRFKADLEDERDQLLSRGGALMVIQQVLG